MSRTITSLCVAGITSLALFTPTAAFAADGARGEANAITATLLGESGDSGWVRATNDGSGENKTGPVNPLPTVLEGQPYAGIGVLAQDAAAANNGTSAACAGVAGDGGSANVVEVGDSDCLEPGDNVDIQLANLDLSTLLEAEVASGSGAISDVLALLPEPGQREAFLSALQDAVDQIEENLGNAGLVLDLGAIESSCEYDGEGSGTTFLTRVGIDLVIPQVGRETLITFDPEPAPNTKLPTGIDDLTDLVLQELRDGLNDNLDDLTDPIYDTALDPFQEQVVEQVVLQLKPALEDVEAELLEVWLNKQDEGDDGSIAVTGLSVSLLPGAAEFGAPEILELEIANVECAPYHVTEATRADTEGNPVPTVVNAGEGSTSWVQGGLMGLLALLVAGGTALGLRRARS
jgi:hypothetical protein